MIELSNGNHFPSKPETATLIARSIPEEHSFIREMKMPILKESATYQSTTSGMAGLPPAIPRRQLKALHLGQIVRDGISVNHLHLGTQSQIIDWKHLGAGLMNFRLRLLLILALPLVLSSCVYFSITSSAVFANSTGNQELMLLIREKVAGKIDSEGGSCRLNNLDDNLLRCLTSNKMSVSTGFDQDDELFIYIDSGIELVMPPSQSRLENGSYLPSEHEDWENWINTEFQGYDFKQKIRRTTGGFVHSF